MNTALKMISPDTPVPPDVTITDDLIAQRAYERWEQRGCPLWDDAQDWFAAQQALEAEARDARERSLLVWPRRVCG